MWDIDHDVIVGLLKSVIKFKSSAYYTTEENDSQNIIRPVPTFFRSFVAFEDVDTIFNVSKLCLQFLKERFNLLVWPCIEAVVDVITLLCG